MRGPKVARVLAAACLLALVGAGCTPEPDPRPTPTAVTPTPTESDQEREQRVAYEAAEKSYREFRAEFTRVTNAGGASDATPVMKATAGGPYLAELTATVRAFKKVSYRTTGIEKIGYVKRGGYSPDSLILNTCEDDRGTRTLKKNGDVAANGDLLLLELEVKRQGVAWKVWSGQSKVAKSCD